MMTPTCECPQDIQELIVLAADMPEALSDEETAQLEKALAECADCRAYRQSILHLTASIGEMDAAPVPAGLTDRIMDRIAAQKAEAAPAANVVPLAAKRKGGVKKFASLAAAVLMVAVAVTTLMPSISQTGGPSQNIAQVKPVTVEKAPVATAETPAVQSAQTVAVDDDDRSANAGTQTVAMKQPAVAPVKKASATQPAIKAPVKPAAKKAAPTTPRPKKEAQRASVVIAEKAPEAAPAGNSSPNGQLIASAAEVVDEMNDLYEDPLTDIVGF